MGIGGIFRTLRTLPVMWDFARDMEEVCPDAWFLNYTNPMCMLVMGMARTPIKTVGLCHSVQACVPGLLGKGGVDHPSRGIQAPAATEDRRDQPPGLAAGDHRRRARDLYPEIRQLAAAKNAAARARWGIKKRWDMVRYEFMKHFGYYITESSEHSSEYMPYWIKSRYPELIREFNIPLDEYPRRCVCQIEAWIQQRDKLKSRSPDITHERSHEYGSYIMEAIETDVPIRIHGNIMNDGLITNLPRNCWRRG